jgi:hypothetical protein
VRVILPVSATESGRGVMLPVIRLVSNRYPKTGLPLLSVMVMTRPGNEIAWVPASALAKLPVKLLTAN